RLQEEPTGKEMAPPPAFALLVIDGIEESANANWWTSRLSELLTFLPSRPRIKLVVTTRDSTSHYLPADQFARHWVDERNGLPLEEIFRAYVTFAEIDVGPHPWLPWALRTPLAIRLFAQLNRKRTLTPLGFIATGLPDLIRQTIANLDLELRQHELQGW